MIQIAIDGPGGAGKTTLSKAIAKKMGIVYVDTGAMYRTVGLYVRDHLKGCFLPFMAGDRTADRNRIRVTSAPIT